MNNPQIWIGCLAAYNNGYLHGEWVDATIGSDYIQEQINKILASSPIEAAEEWEIFDYDGVPRFIIDNHKNFDDMAEWCTLYQEEGEKIIELADHMAFEDIQELKNYHEDNYEGEWDSFQDFAEYTFNECYGHEIPEHIRFYIDYEAFARDLSYDYFEIYVNGDTHIYRNS